jgi:peptidoglycan/xylan/chitin deacetylase (PgdA/CDA1 family)
MFFYRTPVTGHFLDPSVDPPTNNPLPDGTLCLTYDDGPGVTSTPTGPGARTDDLGFYLFLQGIPATFFVIGERAVNEPGLCVQLMQQGHLVVTHTDNHIWMPWDADPLNTDTSKEQDLIDEVLVGASNIGAAANPASLLLRPPYGAWSKGVADVLNGDPGTRKFTGPIMGDIGAYDWMYWDNLNYDIQNNTTTGHWTPQDCSDQYYIDITKARKGTIIMHDCAAIDDQGRADINRTYEMTQLLIPRLIADGYRFIRLDALPQVRSAMQVSSIAGLRATAGYVSPQGGGGGSILANGQGLFAWEELGLVQLAGSRIAIRTSNGQFMSTHPNGDVLADGNGAFDWEMFQLVDQLNRFFALKSLALNQWISAPNTGQIRATPTTAVGPFEQFVVEYVAQ